MNSTTRLASLFAAYQDSAEKSRKFAKRFQEARTQLEEALDEENRSQAAILAACVVLKNKDD